MEGKHITSDHYRHEHHNSGGTEETHHRKESHSGWACHKCGWTHPNQHPSAKQRRNHKKHCGKIEGFKLINSVDTEKKGTSSEDVSSDEEHKSTEHTEKEGKDITSHQHQHEQPLHPSEQNHHTKERHGYVCHRCGWTYPNPHPNAKHRKNHKRHCGKIEGFKLISSEEKEIQGGSSDDESSDDELKSTDHEKLSSLNKNNVATQKNASPSTSDYTSGNLGINSNEDNAGAIQTLCISDNATLEPPETTGIYANAGNSIMFGESGKETLVESTVTTVGLGMHGLNASGTVEPSKNLIGPDMVISEDKSNPFYKVIPDTDNSQYSSGSVEHEELPVNSHQFQNLSRIQAPRTFGISAPTPVHAAKEHNIGISSRRVGIASILSFNGLNSGDLNPKVPSVEETPASADTKIYELSQTNHQVYESQTQEVLVSETKEDKSQHLVAIPSDLNEGLNIKLPLETESQKDYPPSLAFEPETEKMLQFTSNKPENYMYSKSISPSASRDSFSSREVEKPSNLSNTNSQDTLNPESDNKMATRVPSGLRKPKAGEETEYPHSESIEKIPVHQQASSEIIIADQERSADGSSTTYSKAGEWKEAESCGFMDSSTNKHDMKICDPNCKKEESALAIEVIDSDPNCKMEDSALASEVIDSENSAKSETCGSEYAIISDEKKNSEEHDMFFKPGDYIESKNISPMHEDADRYREEEKPPNFENSKSDDMLHPEEEKEKIINQETMKGPSSEGIESNSGQKIDEQAKNLVIPYQETSSTDSFATEYSKEGKKQQTECSSIRSSSTIEHDMKDYDPESRIGGSTRESIVTPGTDIVRDADTPVNEVANENQEAIKGPCSEGIESTSGQKLDEQASNVVILDQETCGTGSFATEYSKEGEKQQTECSSIRSSNTIEHDMKGYNPESRTANSTLESIVMTGIDIVRDADTPVNEVANENQAAVKGLSCEGMESTSGLTIDEQASNVVIPDQETSGTGSFSTEYSREGEEQKTECSSITSFGTIEHDMKDNNPDCRTADSTPENIVMPATNIVRDDDTPVNEVANENQEAIKGPPSEVTEFTSVQKLEERASNVVIPDQETSSTDSFPTEYSKEGEKKQQTECCSITSSSTIEHDMKDYSPDCRMVNSSPENIIMPGTDIVRDADTPVNEVANENEAAVKGLSSEGIESTSGLKIDEQASNVVSPDQETSGTGSFLTEYSREGEEQKTECSSITSFGTIEHNMKDYNPDCRTADSTPENIVMPATDIVRDADTPVNEVANENQEVIKSPPSEVIEFTSGQKLEEQASNVVIPDQETIGSDIFPTEYSKEGEKKQTECSLITSSSTIEHNMKDYNPDCRMTDSTPENVVMPDTNIVKDAGTPINVVANENREAIKGPFSEVIESISGQKPDEQASNVVIPDQETSGNDSFPTEYSKVGDKQRRESSSIATSSTIEHDLKNYNPDCRMAENIVMPATDIVKDADRLVNEVTDEKSAVAESHYPESMVYNHEQKSTVEQAISVNPAEYIESKEIHNLEKANVMKESCSGGIETTSDQKLISQASSKLVITDKAMSSADRPPIEYSGLGETQQNECTTPTKSSIIEPCVRDADPDSKKDYSIQGNIKQPVLDRDGHIDSFINVQKSLSEAAATEVVHANSAPSESVQSNTKNTYSSSQDVAHANFGAEIAEEELQYKQQGLKHYGVEQSDQFKVDNVNYTSCSTIPTVADNSLQSNASSTDGHGNSLKESMDDVHGSKTESLKTCEPALWEQLLESNAKELNDPEIYQDLGNAQQSPDNPFTYGQNFSCKEEAHQTFHIEGGQGQISDERKNNSADLEAPADMVEAPSFITLVETLNHSEIWPSHREIQPSADLVSGGCQNGDLSAAAAESDSEGLERPHTPLRNLLAEENKRGTQDRSSQDPPLVEQPKTSSQNNIQGVHASSVRVTDQGGMSSLNLEIAQKDSNSSSKKIMEKVWNSPARLPSPKVEKQKVKVKSAWSMCLCGSATN